MRRVLYVVAAVVGVWALGACSPDMSSPTSPDPSPLRAANRASPQSQLQALDVIVVLDPAFAPGGHGANQAAAVGVARGLGIQARNAYGTAVFGFSGTLSAGRLAALQRDPRVLRVELDQTATAGPGPVDPGDGFTPTGLCDKNPDHPKCGGGGGGEDPPPPPQVVPWGIARVGGGAGAHSGTAWIIDSGIDLDHPDLNVDVARSIDFTNDRKPNPDDQNGHGTHVAGTVAALDNGFGVIGVAPGAPVVAVRVLDRRGSGSYSDVIAGVDYVAANGAPGDVANMSLGGGFSQTLNDAVVAASAVVRFSLAAGNESTDAATRSPASANGPNVYTVSAFAEGDVWASYSNFGNPPVDFAAPGSGVLSTYKGGAYATASGTSMAAPHVAGILLLGSVGSDGTVSGDPDGAPDPIAHH